MILRKGLSGSFLDWSLGGRAKAEIEVVVVVLEALRELVVDDISTEASCLLARIPALTRDFSTTLALKERLDTSGRKYARVPLSDCCLLPYSLALLACNWSGSWRGKMPR